MFTRIGLVALLLCAASSAFGQAVQQSGSVTPNTVAIWNSTGVIKGGVTATDSPLTSFSVTRDAADGFCVSSARSTAVGRNQLCFQAATSGPGKISLQNYGTATAQDLQFVINGNTVTIPTGGSNFVQASGVLVSGHFPKWSGTSGLVIDSGVGAGAGTQFGLAYYSAADTIGSTGAGTDGQMVVGQTGAAPLWKTLSGDVGSVSAAGAVTINKVNGVSYANTYAAHGVLLGNGTSAFNSTTTSNVGYCLLSQGLSSDPIWAACASGGGSAGGSDTQVQFNSSTTLAGSANFTWVSPALRLGVSGTTTGQLQLNSAAGVSGAVTVQAPTATAAYNFNLPTGAGTTGQPLISGGGGATAMTFGTLGIFGGGTNCAAASGTCLDNITSFSSTGYINRTGSGTYAFSTVIPVSGGGTNLASGTSGGILGYTASGVIASSAALAQNGFVIGGGAGATPTTLTACSNGQIPVGVTSSAPACQTLTGDISAVTSGGSVTIANSAITLAKQANAAAYSIYGNFTGSTAAPQVSTLGALTQKASPAAGDYLLLQDNAAAGALKYATVSSIASAGSVGSVNLLTGAITVASGTGITVGTSSPNITVGLSSARQTLPTVQTFTSGTNATYTTPANVLWIEIWLVGGGAGGAGGNNGANSTAGNPSCWKTSGTACSTPDYQAGGGGVANNTAAGLGGTVSGANACNLLSATGNPGSVGTAATSSIGGLGGSGGGPGAGVGGAGAVNGTTATANSGGGGGGGGVAAATIAFSGAGGGNGATCAAIINSPAATYVYTVGGTASAAANGSGGGTGGNGAAGKIWVVEHYGS